MSRRGAGGQPRTLVRGERRLDDIRNLLYKSNVMDWEVEYTDQFGDWWDGLTKDEQEAVTAAVNVLARRGPSLGRPLVDTIKQSRHANMKELIAPTSDIRILFAFDPRRMAILLIGGSKTREWNAWYDRNVPIADDLFDEHLRELEREGAPNAQDP
jgi:hypothetical protein